MRHTRRSSSSYIYKPTYSSQNFLLHKTLKANKFRSKSKSPFAIPQTRGAVVASQASSRVPHVVISPSSGPYSVAPTETTAKNYQNQSLPVLVVQPSVKPVLEMASHFVPYRISEHSPSRQSSLHYQELAPIEIQIVCLTWKTPTPFSSVVSSLWTHVPIALKEKI